ncbi:class I SAM-dependent methyltransferase [Candidatus Symbiobacter mobilis]|uniref:Methyltransferase type 12 n=1 Tax=Candidatus Symbiobacter mobilis CR TaxID=946483 RepID=U5N3T3_9BURK|nr:class I SAM-dependent methyltransferase [Candidatus Symbiobacter mobilis]AGX86151.1 methyltransferase type 12 [Candidatus Symbiobacter mobilis CR]
MNSNNIYGIDTLEMRCPLCYNTPQILELINSEDVIAIWGKVGIDVSQAIRKSEITKCQCNICGLGYYYPFIPGDALFYGKLADWDWYYKHPGKTEYEFTLSVLNAKINLFDVGCGIGEFSTYLPDGVNYFGSDLCEKSVEIAKSMGRNVDLIDIMKISDSLKDSFDAVTCFQVLEHVIDIHGFFSALVSLCKPGGIIVLAVPNNSGFIGYAVNNILNMPPHHVLLWSKKSLIYLANKYNIEVLNYVEEKLSDVHRHWAVTTMVRFYLCNIIQRKQKTVDISFIGRIIGKISSLFAYPIGKLFPNLVTVGHSSIIVLKKNEVA